MGLKTAAEIFADRAYMEDLSLVPWKQCGAMITDCLLYTSDAADEL